MTIDEERKEKQPEKSFIKDTLQKKLQIINIIIRYLLLETNKHKKDDISFLFICYAKSKKNDNTNSERREGRHTPILVIASKLVQPS